MLTVVIPTLNEEKNPLLRRSLERLCTFKEIVTVMVDGGSSDGTERLASDFQVRFIKAPGTNRAQRLNIGVRKSEGRMVLLYHPRSLVDVGGLSDLLENKELLWGGFRHRFDDPHPLLHFTSWYSNRVRFKLSGVVYLDHCIFVQRRLLLQAGGVPEADIFEDTLLSKRLRLFGKPQLIPYDVITSAVRFQQNGYWRQALLNQILKLQYFLKFDPEAMNQKYERGLNLNNKAERRIPKSVKKRSLPPPS